METDTVRNDVATKSERVPRQWKLEALAILTLAALTGYFLRISWRKWPDPLIDVGPQWYAIWRTSQGALPYHDFLWNYGPLSLCFNAGLFKCFGPGMMVLVTANLVIYGLILSLAYAAFRLAWGRLGAFVAAVVFISVFSFSHLTSVGNYNFVTPYTHESTHGILLLLATALIAVRWSRQKSRKLAFALGLCGGVAVVMKPEFMLAG
ncbi:MAG: 4-amino-4-deoxy-L-arabinose transferase and related glycosyltransferase of family, partial [Pedosphaera sp.]|nr:4-amino-4-deoxy-L-arabinose transferase and related glycosyltransferase of family [Pedosphaera sp.]